MEPISERVQKEKGITSPGRVILIANHFKVPMNISKQEMTEDVAKVHFRKYAYLAAGIGLFVLAVLLVVMYFVRRRDWGALALATAGFVFSGVMLNQAWRMRGLEAVILARMEGRDGEDEGDTASDGDDENAEGQEDTGPHADEENPPVDADADIEDTRPDAGRPEADQQFSPGPTGDQVRERPDLREVPRLPEEHHSGADGTPRPPGDDEKPRPPGDDEGPGP